jgi:hypothetical protein
MVVFGYDGLGLPVVAVQEVLEARVWALVANMDILVFEEACLGGEIDA